MNTLHTSRRAKLHGMPLGTISQFLSTVGRGDQPVAAMLTCWELGRVANEVSHARPCEILVVTSSGAVVPANGRDGPTMAIATVFACLEMPTVRHLIVCGHRNCEMVPLLLGDRRTDLLPEYRAMLREVRRDLRWMNRDLSDTELCSLAVEEVVLQQILHLLSYPGIRCRWENADLQIHGWRYDDATIRAYCPQENQFLP